MKNDEILIIRCQIPMKPQKADILRKQILEQKETGVILLPNYCTVVTKPKDIDIQVEQQERTCPCCDCKYFIKEGMGALYYTSRLLWRLYV